MWTAALLTLAVIVAGAAVLMACAFAVACRIFDIEEDDDGPIEP
jgi:hypothetical protein